MQLESMYQDIILDHYKNPHGRGLREPFEAEVHHVNPTCGDEVTLRVHLAGGEGLDAKIEDIHPHDVGQVLDDLGIAVRVGHHCAWPVVRRYGVPATTRATFYVHTGYDDIDALADGIRAAQKFFGTV
jgi:selenocysteine lyase/cysteine desulfurase